MEEEEYWEEDELSQAPSPPGDSEVIGVVRSEIPWFTPEAPPPEEEDESDISVWRMVADALGERMEG